eukprot:TRINITY_DN49006_c0_g1_i1.p1 TRINITY_DN49006_c0_g1~~TRINITY_DN49006_c0_g1_i1.p1  ORF type:complete len:374 (-),score=57.66 TRINITY_DN49006_c0_g1_i1:152-1273(-)
MEQYFKHLCSPRGRRGSDLNLKSPGERSLLLRPFPELPESLGERGEVNSAPYLNAEDGILAIEDEFTHASESKLCGKGLEDVQQLLADEPDPEWSARRPWEDLTSKPASLHEVLQAMEIIKFCSQQQSPTENQDELVSQCQHSGQSRPRSAQIKRPSSASCSTRPGSSRPSSAGSSCGRRSSSARAIVATGAAVQHAEACAIRKAVPPKGLVPKERYRMPRRPISNKPPAPSCQAASPASASRKRLLMLKQHSAAVWAAHAATAAAPQRPATAVTCSYAASSAGSSMHAGRPRSAAAGLRESLQQQTGPGRPAFQPLTSRGGGPPPRVGVCGHGPVKAFATAANPRLALLEAARCHAPKAPSSRPSTAGTVRR